MSAYVPRFTDHPAPPCPHLGRAVLTHDSWFGEVSVEFTDRPTHGIEGQQVPALIADVHPGGVRLRPRSAGWVSIPSPWPGLAEAVVAAHAAHKR